MKTWPSEGLARGRKSQEENPELLIQACLQYLQLDMASGGDPAHYQPHIDRLKKKYRWLVKEKAIVSDLSTSAKTRRRAENVD